MDRLIEEQTYTDNNLKGFLLSKNNIHMFKNSNDTLIQEGVTVYENRVDNFMKDVVEPLKQENKLNVDKLQWYYEIYKEAQEARKVKTQSLFDKDISHELIQSLIQTLKDKNVEELLSYGTSYISTAFSLISSWYRDMMILSRLDTLYYSEDPVEWIKKAEENEKDIMEINVDSDPSTRQLLHKMSLIMKLKI